MTIHTIPDIYGFWDPAGRNLFFRFPRFSFIDLKNEIKIASNHIIFDSLDLNPLDKEMDVQIKHINRKIYIRVIDDIKPIIDFVTNQLPAYLISRGKLIDGSVRLLDEIMIGVKDDPESQKDSLLSIINTNPLFYKYSSIRPFESMPD